jgi:hypothetical protein
MTALPELPELPREKLAGLRKEVAATVRGKFQHYYDVMGIDPDATPPHLADWARAYGRQCYAAGMELAAQIADKHSGPSTLASENSDMYSIQNRWAKVIAKAIRGTGAAS